MQLEDVEESKDDLKSELDHFEGLLACRAQSVTRVYRNTPLLLCPMPRDINLLLGEEDINHLIEVLQDDQNDFTFFHQIGLLSANI